MQQESFERSLPGLDGKPPSGIWGGGQSHSHVGEAVKAEERGERPPGGKKGGTSGWGRMRKETALPNPQAPSQCSPWENRKTGHQGLQPVATRGTLKGLGVRACL